VRIRFVLVLFIASSWLGSTDLFASADEVSAATRVEPSSEGVIPPYMASFPSTGAIGTGMSHASELAEWRASIAVDTAPEFAALADDETTPTSSKGKYLPVLYSLLIPGTGEIALGYPKRGIALIALEVAAWVGYAYYNDQGLDGRAEFEAFADTHWDHDKWIGDHPAVEGFPANLKTFEVLDSVGQFWWQGWLRDQYRALRRESNSDLDTADRFIYLSVVTRVFSLVETVILARRSDSKGADSDDSEKSNYSFTTRSTSLTSGEVAFEYRF
jgi:hypothetical protein